jgi:predicted ATPase
MNESTPACLEANVLNGERLRIVLSGGPGGGKTTAADLFRRELGERVVVVPESASMLFNGGFPRYLEHEAVLAAQRAIYHVQRNLEDMQLVHYPGRILLCDRGTLDGAAYCSDTVEAGMQWFETFGTTIDAELARYDAVVFFETAAAGGLQIEGGNPARIETIAAALELDHRLRALWSRHPCFTLVRHERSFLHKLTTGLAAIDSIVNQWEQRHSQASATTR